MRIVCAVFLCCGCADFSVAPAGGRDAPGVHFFLPKPYVLFWWEREIMWKSGTPVHSLIPRCQVILLPDVSQRYAITQHAWCAKGDFSYQLKDGWRLEMINGAVDTSEFLRSATEPAAAAVEGAFARTGTSADAAPALPPPILYEPVWRDDAGTYEFRRVALEGLTAVPPQ